MHFIGALWFLQVSDRAEYLGSALLHRGLEPSPKSFIGIFAQNRPEVIFQLQQLYLADRLSLSLYSENIFLNI